MWKWDLSIDENLICHRRIYCKFGNYCVHLLLRSSKIFTDCDFYYCEAWSPPVQMDTYDSEMRGLIIAILHQSHFSQ
jgi:hypothetical protein